MAKSVSRSQLWEVCESLGFAEAHAQCVAALGERLFAETRHLHGLTKTSRALVSIASALHTRNGQDDGHAPKRARRDATLRKAFPRLSASQRRIVERAMSIAASNDGAPAGAEPGSHACRCGLDDELGQVALRVAALVRVADGLDRSHTQDTRLVGVLDDGEGVDLLIAGPSAEGNARAALEGAALWNALMPRPIRAVKVHEGRPPSDALIAPTDSLARAARLVLLRQLEAFMARTYGLWCDKDIEYVHELRVALRRARSALRVFRDALNGDRAALRTELKWFAAELGTVRDLDVFLRFLTAYRDQAPDGHRPFVRRLVRSVQALRRRHYRKLLDVFQADRYRAFIGRFHPLLAGPVGAEGSLFVPSPEGKKRVWKAAPRLLRQRLKRLLRRDRRLSHLTPDEQHELRIECKRMRYAAEFLADIYPGRLVGLIEAMTALQDELGEVHDADVYRDRVLAYWQRRERSDDGGERRAVEGLLGHLRDQRARHLRRAARDWKAFTRRTHVERLREMLGLPREA